MQVGNIAAQQLRSIVERIERLEEEKANIGADTGFASPGGNTNPAGAHTHTITGSTGSVGGGEAHSHSIPNASHLPPYFALAFIMKL